MPYLTPESVPESTTCRALLIPDSTDWLAIFSGALTELSLRWNWQQQGITVDEALAVVQAVIDGYYNGCVTTGCAQPNGDPVFRLNPETWEIEQLVNGEWVPPQGDAALPPTPPRSEPTADERMCLAAANAVNALSLLYESLSDSWSSALGLQDAINAMMAVLIGIVGTAFGLPVAALIGIFVVLMSVVYETIEYITADVWTEDFSEKLACYFYECSSDDGDVVHFDIQCIINKIGAATTFDWDTEAQLRLLLQVSWLMSTLGAQTIDAAGATTAVEDADCDECAQPCITVDFTEDSYDYTFISYPSTVGIGTVDAVFGNPQPSGKGYSEGDGMFFGIEIEFPTPRDITALSFQYFQTGNPFGSTFVREMVLRTADGTILTDLTSVTGAAVDEWDTWTPFGAWDGTAIKKVQLFLGISGGSAADGTCWMDNITICFS